MRNKIILMTILVMLAEILRQQAFWYDALMIAVAVIGGVPIIIGAWKALRYRIISIELLVSTAVIGAVILGEFNEAGIVAWLFCLGEVLQNLILSRTQSAIRKLTEMVPDKALLLKDIDDDEPEEVSLSEIRQDDLLLVRAGDRIPADGTVVKGFGKANQANLTGEEEAVFKDCGKEVFAGTILEDGMLVISVSRVGSGTVFGRIIELVEDAQDSKPRVQKMIDRFAKYYTPAVFILALAVGIVLKNAELGITILVLGCPGALVIGIPVSLAAGIGRMAQENILIKGASTIESLSKIDALAFDKTGTLTVGRLQVEEMVWKRDDRSLLKAIESRSSHPLAGAIVTALEDVDSGGHDVSGMVTVPGKGIEAVVDGKKVRAGNAKFVGKPDFSMKSTGKSRVYLSVDGEVTGGLAIGSCLRDDAVNAVERLRRNGIRKIVLLSGDNQEAVDRIAEDVGISEGYGELMPDQKVEKINELRQEGFKVGFVGDGINDGPALALAHVGIAIGSGTDVALDVADAVLMTSELTKLDDARAFAGRIEANMKENIVIAVLTVVILLLGLVFGYIHMGSGMLVHEASILLVILNGMRLLGRKLI